MANLIQLFRSPTSGNKPASLSTGELAINYADGTLFWADSGAVVRTTQLFAAPLSALAPSNLAINGAMAVSQFNAGASISPGTSTYVIDGFKAGFVNSGAVFGAQQISPLSTMANPPFGASFPYMLQLISHSAIAALAATDYATISTTIEGYRWAPLGYGATGGQNCTIGFWLYADGSGTATLSVQNATNNRSYVVNFTVANGWQWVVLVIPPDSAGTWNATNLAGATLTWCFACGSTFQSTNQTWAGGNYIGTAQTGNLFTSNGNRVCITGLVVVAGNIDLAKAQAPFMIESFSNELQKCRRYWRKSYDYAVLPGTTANYGNVAKAYFNGLPSAVYSAGGHIEHGTPMRTAATLIGYSPSSGAAGNAYDANAAADVAVTLEHVGENGFDWRATNSAAAAGADLRLHWVADARL